MADFIVWSDEQIAAASPAERLAYRRYVQRHLWRQDPARWVRERLKEHPWSKQIEVLESLLVNRHTAVPAGFDLGKSWIASRAVMFWIDTAEPDENVFVVTTAPSNTQVKGIIWREINMAHRKAKLAGSVSSLNWRLAGRDVAIGYKPSDYGQAGFQGFHADRVLVVLDEAAGVVDMLWDGAEGIAANDDSRILAIGNPEAATDRFGKVCEPGSNWNVIRIRAFDSPRVTGEPIPEKLVKNLVGPTWIEERRNEWGEDSPMWLSKVEAQFVRDMKMAVVPYSWAMNCARREDDVVDSDDDLVELGCDVGAGGDESVIIERRGNRVGRIWASQHEDSELLAGDLMYAIRETGASSIKIDGIGVGWGVAGFLRNLIEQHDLECVVHVVDVRNSSSEPHKYANLRSEIWWEIGREMCRTQGWDLTDLLRNEDAELQKRGEQTINEMCEPKYKNDTAGRIRVEPKEDTIKRLKRSPDHADALLLAFYTPPETGLMYLGTV